MNEKIVVNSNQIITGFGNKIKKHDEQFISIKNNWLKDVSTGYIAHKGFNGIDSNIKSSGIASLNTSKSLNLAGELGFKIVEFDVNILADGTWVIEHDNEIDTDNTFTSKVALDTLTLEQLKNYELYRSYINLGHYWVYGDNNKHYKVMTLEEGLNIVKKYNMYALIEIKWAKTYQYKDSDLVNLANTIKKVGMENKSILFTAHEGYLNTLMSNLPKSIAGLMLTSVDGTTLSKFNNYSNYLALCDTTLFENNYNFFTTNNIPVATWTIDRYEKAEELFKKGCNFVITNTLLGSENKIPNDYKIISSFTLDDFLDTKGSDSTITRNGNFVTYTTSNYANSYKIIDKSLLKEGDIIKISCEGRTISSDNVNYCRMSINNDGAQYFNRTSLSYFKNNSFEYKELYYVVTETVENAIVRFGAGGNSVSGTSNCDVKNIKVDVFRKEVNPKVQLKNERFAKIYAYDNAFMFRSNTTKYYINSVDSSGTELIINYELFTSTANPLVFIQIDDYSRDFKYHIIPSTDNTTNGQVRLKIFNDTWEQVTTLNSGLRLSFSILIKNLE